MNRHFEDTRYHLERAGYHVVAGVRDEVEPYETRLRELVGLRDEDVAEDGWVARYTERARTDARRYVAEARGVVADRAE